MRNTSAVRLIDDDWPSNFVEDNENCAFDIGHMMYRMLSSVKVPDVKEHITRAEEKLKLVYNLRYH